MISLILGTDSEGFRYLAAYKNKITMDNQEDHTNSWKHSRKEALRLLEHFRGQKPHSVQSTVSLNGTRELILQLTKPMADISQLIRTNIALCEDKVQELVDTRLTGEQLRKRLHLQKIHLTAEPLAKPRTVCSDASCTEFKDDGNGENKTVTVYKAHCHEECYLDNVKVDQIAHPGLISCAAFGGSTTCQHCQHSWQVHLHVLYELKESTVTVTDTEIETQLRAHVDDVILVQTAVNEHQNRVEEYKLEHAQIQEAAARFGVFLKKNSITAYNDATLEYLDYLIREEKSKVQAGGNKKKLKAFEEDHQKHKELVDVLTKSMGHANSQSLNEAGVDDLVKNLYKLKHFGDELRDVKQTITEVYKATYRELPFRVEQARSSTWKDPIQEQSLSGQPPLRRSARSGSHQKASGAVAVPESGASRKERAKQGFLSILPWRR